MIPNFRISFHLNSDNLHLVLTGDFNEHSADKLLQVLKSNSGIANQIFIHTSKLNSIQTVSPNQNYVTVQSLNNGMPRLVFTGDKAQQLVEELEIKPFLVKP